MQSFSSRSFSLARLASVSSTFAWAISSFILNHFCEAFDWLFEEAATSFHAASFLFFDFWTQIVHAIVLWLQTVEFLSKIWLSPKKLRFIKKEHFRTASSCSRASWLSLSRLSTAWGKWVKVDRCFWFESILTNVSQIGSMSLTWLFVLKKF